ncbi:MAG: hypothetical protein P8Y80_08015 [Acidobacteriota bacterium]|jgi:hypothetical protein
MRKASWHTTAAVLMAVLFTATVSLADVDVTGTWIGTASVPNEGDDKIHCVVKKEDDQYSAVFNDSFGVLANIESYEFEYKDDTLVIKIIVPGNYGDLDITITLKVSEDTLGGEWIAQGTEQRGTIELKRQQ